MSQPKTTALLSLLVVLVLVVTGCTVTAPQTQEEAAPETAAEEAAPAAEAEEAPAETEAAGEELFLDVGEHPPITLLINSSPWFAGFEAVVNLYQEQTGNVVNLDVNPYPAMLEKIRNAVRDTESPYDWVNIDAPWTVELYSGDFLTPIKEIDPDFELDPAVIDYGESLFWNPDNEWRQMEGGALLSLPTNGNFTIMFYRTDLYEEAGLEPPETWDQLLDNCEVLQNPDEGLHCFVVRADRGSNFFNSFLYMYEAQIMRDPANGDFTVTINSPEALEAMELNVLLANTYGPPNQGAIGQADMIQLMATGQVIHMINVVAAWPNFDDPDNSNVVGMVDALLPPRPENGQHATRLSNWVAGIPRNIPDERKEAALAFMKWFLTYDAQYRYAEFGAVPIRSDVYASDLSEQDEFRWMDDYFETFEYGVHPLPIAEASQVADVINIRLNQAIIQELSPAEALNGMADDIYQIFQQSGRDTGQIEPLPE